MALSQKTVPQPTISFHRRSEIRDRSAEGRLYRIAGMNLLDRS